MPILWAYQTGVVCRHVRHDIRPGPKPVTREQIAVILMGYVDRILKLEHTWDTGRFERLSGCRQCFWLGKGRTGRCRGTGL